MYNSGCAGMVHAMSIWTRKVLLLWYLQIRVETKRRKTKMSLRKLQSVLFLMPKVRENRRCFNLVQVLTWCNSLTSFLACPASWSSSRETRKKTGNKLHLAHFLKKNLLPIHKPFLNFTIFERSPLSSFLSFLIVYLHKLFDSFLQHWRNVHHF